MVNIKHIIGKRCGIYKITNTKTGDFYIGSSLHIYHRLRRHLSDLRGKRHANPKLTNSFNKHGEANFQSEIIEETEAVDLLIREEHWIDLLKPKYNCLGLFLSRPVNTPVMRLKISKATAKAIKEGRLSCGKKPIDVFNLKGVKISSHGSIKEVTKVYPVSRCSITRVLDGRHNQNKGYIFRLSKDKVESVDYSPRVYDLTKNYKTVKCENVVTGEVEWYESLKSVKSKFGVTVIFNIKSGYPYKKTYKFTYATKPDELLETPVVKQDNQQPSMLGIT